MLGIAIAGIACLLPVQAASAADTKPFTVTITHVECVDDCDRTGLEGPLDGTADFYANVRINGVKQPPGSEDDDPSTPVIDDKRSIDPHWRVSTEVPSALQNVPVTIQIWDEDRFDDDNGDVSPRDNDSNLDFEVNYDTGRWADPTGNQDRIDFPQACSTGDGGENDQPRVKVCFDVSTSKDGDTDDDGIPDGVERFGMPDSSGNLVPIPDQRNDSGTESIGMQMDPCRKTIALEVDWMSVVGDHTHRPTFEAVQDAVAAMNAGEVDATTPCPYAGFPTQRTGVNLVIDRSNSIDEQAVFPLGSLAGVRDADQAFAPRRPYMHYVLFVHDQAAGNSSSGRCCAAGRDFIVSLGSWEDQVGTYRDQSATIVHELGHALGLGHGGDETRNYKPNYVSVMNYFFDPTGIPDPTIPANIDTDGDDAPDQSFRLDYSRRVLPNLVKDALAETKGISDGTDFTFWFDPAYKVRSSQGNAEIDWNQVGGSAEAGIGVDLNADPCIDAGGNGTIDTTPAGDDVAIKTGAGPIIVAGPTFICDTLKSGDDGQALPKGTNVVADPALKTLHGYDDWANIDYRGAMAQSAAGGAVNHGPDMTFEQAELQKNQIYGLFSPDLEVSKEVDRSDAAPGESLVYSLTGHNAGTGAAKSVEMLDTLPDGSTATRSLGMVDPGQSKTAGLTYEIPCTTADGSKLTNTASISGTNLLNNPEVNTANNGASASTTVHAPALTLSKTATASVNAGEAITYRLAYENTGSGEARSVMITDTLPADVYYSTALDQGAGPAPDGVTRNVDGTTTLTWSVASVAGGSGTKAIEYTARPSLLFMAGSSVENRAQLTFTNAGGCEYTPVTSSLSAAVTAMQPSRAPLTQGYWRTHPAEWTSEILARIQATDQTFDGADGSLPDGRLSATEAAAVLTPGGTPPKILQSQLLATYFNLATRRINAATVISSKAALRLRLNSVRDAALYAIATRELPPSSNRDRYSDAILVLDEINMNTSEIY